MTVPDITRVHTFIAESTQLYDRRRGGGRSVVSSSDCDHDDSDCDSVSLDSLLGDHLFLSSSTFDMCMEEVDDEIHSYTIMKQPCATDEANGSSVLYCSASNAGGRLSVGFNLKRSRDAFLLESRGLPKLDAGTLDVSRFDNDPWHEGKGESSSSRPPRRSSAASASAMASPRTPPRTPPRSPSSPHSKPKKRKEQSSSPTRKEQASSPTERRSPTHYHQQKKRKEPQSPSKKERSPSHIRALSRINTSSWDLPKIPADPRLHRRGGYFV